MVRILDISLFSANNFDKISRGRSCYHGISALASLFGIKTNTRVRNYLIWRINAITMCLKTVYNVTAKMLWPSSFGRTGNRLFVTIELICRAIKGCVMEISSFFFCHLPRPTFWKWSCRGQVWPNFHCWNYHFHKEPARIYKMFITVLIVWKYRPQVVAMIGCWTDIRYGEQGHTNDIKILWICIC